MKKGNTGDGVLRTKQGNKKGMTNNKETKIGDLSQEVRN